jgi:asparagine synthase (glutamine-hydrolysing)
MLRYVALVWDKRRAEAAHFAKAAVRTLMSSDSPWRTTIDCPGFILCTIAETAADGQVIPLGQGSGAVLGRFFQRNTSPEEENVETVSRLDERDVKKLINSRGRSAIDRYWGSYVLFLHDAAANSTGVLRGPVSLQPCFWASVHGVHIFFSFVEDCRSLRAVRFTINWDSIRAQAASGDYLTSETGVREISTLIPGEFVEVKNGRMSHDVYWSPASIKSDNCVGSVAEAAQLLRASTQHCVNALTSMHRTVLLQLSGGFDSSVVLASLNQAQSKPKVVSINFYSEGAGDERHYARSMAQKTGTRLIEIASSMEVDLRTFLECAYTANPVLNFSAYDAQPKIVAIARELNATCVFTGEIGDDIFGHAAGPEALVECFSSNASSRTSLKAAVDYADLTRVSLWRALRQARRYRQWRKLGGQSWSFYRYRNWMGFTNDKCFIADGAATQYEDMLGRFIHPWFRNVDEMPAGRTMLMYALVMATSTWSDAPFAGTGRSLFMTPLASQPLVEAFCRIPSHLHFEGGANGAVAREAFGSMLSQEVLKRGTGKGTPSLWIETLVDKNRTFLRDLFLDGYLVRERILDRGKLESMLSSGIRPDKLEVADLVRQIYIEAWIRRWLQNDSAALAA